MSKHLRVHADMHYSVMYLHLKKQEDQWMYCCTNSTYYQLVDHRNDAPVFLILTPLVIPGDTARSSDPLTLFTAVHGRLQISLIYVCSVLWGFQISSWQCIMQALMAALHGSFDVAGGGCFFSSCSRLLGVKQVSRL